MDILKQIEEIRGVKLEKDNNYQKDDCELYNLSYYDTEGFLCYAGVNDDMILMHSPIVDMIPNDSEDVFMKVLHFCHDFNHNYRGVEKLRCYQLNYKYPDDESRYRYRYVDDALLRRCSWYFAHFLRRYGICGYAYSAHHFLSSLRNSFGIAENHGIR